MADHTAYVVGIDPGVNGGFSLVSVCAIEADRTFQGIVHAVRQGQWFHHQDEIGMIDLRRRNVVRPGAVRNFIMECVDEGLVDAQDLDNFVIERQHARVSQGANGQIMFNYGRLVEQCEIELDVRGYGNLFIADPSKWKPDLGLSRDKSVSIKRATEIFGEDARKRYWSRKGDDGVAEASLLAYWRGTKISRSRVMEALP